MADPPFPHALHIADGPVKPERAAPDALSFLELLESEIPAWLPRPPVRKDDGDVTWWRSRVGARELYVHQVYGGGRYRITLLACERVTQLRADDRPPREEVSALPVWPTLEEIWSALDVCPVGAIFQLPGHVVGMVPDLADAVVTITTCTQVGALAGSPAFLRWSLANPGTPQ
ncbi:MAG: hypothetical protein AB7T31_15045 [Gemmatimonadales bacterium]